MGTRRRVVAVVLLGVSLLTAGCTGADGPTPVDTTGGATASTTTAPPTSGTATAPPTATLTAAPATASPATAVPGAAALSPAPSDPAAAGELRTVSLLTGAVLHGHLVLTVSGLVGFDDDVTGTCTRTADRATITARLPDGSVDTTVFLPTSSTTTLVAPDGTTSANTLRETSVTVVDGTLTLDAAMVQAGTSEPSGHVHLTGSCA